jgi:hypothetical protein
MKATDDDLREALGAGSRPSRTDRAACPSADALARAAEGTPQGVAGEIAEHLAVCADCAFEYRLASGLKPWAEGAATAVKPAPARRAAARFLPLAAAACLVACLGLVGWVLALRQQGGRLQAQLADTRQSLQRAELEAADREPAGAPGLAVTEPQALAQPHANVPLVDLFPRDAARGSGPAAAPSVDVAGSPFVVLILNVREPKPGATHAVEILDAGGSVIWAADGVRAGSEPLTLAVPAHLLSADAYQIRLHRLRGGSRTLLEQYDLRVQRRQGSARP